MAKNIGKHLCFIKTIVTEKFAEKLRNMYCKLFFKQTIVLELAAGKDAPNTCQKPAKKCGDSPKKTPNIAQTFFWSCPPKNDCGKSAILKATYIYSYISIIISYM